MPVCPPAKHHAMKTNQTLFWIGAGGGSQPPHHISTWYVPVTKWLAGRLIGCRLISWSVDHWLIVMLVRQSVDQSISVFSAITWLIAQNLLQNSWQIECLTKTPTGLLNDQLTSDSQLTMQPDDRPASKISLASKVYGLVSRLLSFQF